MSYGYINWRRGIRPWDTFYQENRLNSVPCVRRKSQQGVSLTVYHLWRVEQERRDEPQTLVNALLSRKSLVVRTWMGSSDSDTRRTLELNLELLHVHIFQCVLVVNGFEVCLSLVLVKQSDEQNETLINCYRFPFYKRIFLYSRSLYSGVV